MRREFRLQDAKSDKFWIVSVSGSGHTVHFGRTGTNGQRKTKEFDSSAEALAAAEKLIASKIKKGYLERVSADAAGSDPAGADPGAGSTQPTLDAGTKKAATEKAATKKATTKKATTKKATTKKAATKKAATKKAATKKEATTADQDPLAAVAALSPQSWRVAGWRRLPALDRGKAKTFKREAGLKKLRGLQKNYERDYDEPSKLWSKAIPTSITREEAEFWWQAFRRLKRREQPSSVADSLARLRIDAISHEDLASSIPKDPTGHDDPWIGTAAGPDGALRVLPFLFDSQALIETLVQRLSEVRLWAESGTSLRPTLSFLRAFARHVLPYLTQDVLETLRERIRRDLAGSPEGWAGPGRPAGGAFAYYLAGLVGCSEPLEALVQSWADDRYHGDDQSSDVWYQAPLWILLGLGTPEATIAQARRLNLRPATTFELEAWVAVTGELGIEMACEAVLDQPSYMGTDFVKVFGLYRTPAAVPSMLQIRMRKPTTKYAVKWLAEHAEVAARGYLRLAAGQNEDAAEAVDRLITIQSETPEVFAAAVAKESVTPEVLAKLATPDEGDSLALGELSSLLQERFAAVAGLKSAAAKNEAEWLSLRRSPPIRIGADPLGLEGMQLVVRALQAAPLEVRPEGPAPELLAALALEADRESLEDFGWEVFQGWLRNGTQTGHKWCLTGLGFLGSDRIVRQLTPLIRAWPGESQHARAVTGLDVLSQIGSDAALSAIAGIAAKIKFRALKNRAGECMDLIAAGRGLTREQLGDRLVPECGLDAQGRRVFDYGLRRFEFVLGPELKPTVRNEAGKLLKAPPKPGKRDDAALADPAYAEWKIFRKQLTDAVRLQVHRLELAMVCGRRWSTDEFQRFFVDHPLLRHLTRSLLWAACPPSGTIPFRLDEAGAFLDAKGSPVDVGEGPIGLVHPLHLSVDERGHWDALWDEVEVLSPFPQLDREVFTLPPEQSEEITLDTAHCVLTPSKLRSVMISAGWQRGEAQDAGMVSEHVKHFESANLTAILQHEGISVTGYDYWDQAPVEHCLFLTGIHELWDCSWVPVDSGIPLAEVDPLVLSEVIRDLSQLAAAASEE